MMINVVYGIVLCEQDDLFDLFTFFKSLDHPLHMMGLSQIKKKVKQCYKAEGGRATFVVRRWVM